MSRLLLLRHAKSSWANPGEPDRDRPLAPRGEEAAALMAVAMAERGLLPDRVLCSPARRTLETFAALVPRLGEGTHAEVLGDLYEPPTGNYLRAIRSNGADAATLLVVGHNPAIYATALSLLAGGERGPARAIAQKYPTGALAVLNFDDAEWADLAPDGGTLSLFLKPRDLPGGEGMGED